MEPKIIHMDGFTAWVKSIRTTNQNGQSIKDLGAFWQEGFQSGYLGQTPQILGIYSEYEKDFTAPFTFSLGGAVNNGAEVPSGCQLLRIAAGTYALFEAEASSPQDAAAKIWQGIWNWQTTGRQKRAYKTDFETWQTESLQSGQVKVTAHISLVSGEL